MNGPIAKTSRYRCPLLNLRGHLGDNFAGNSKPAGSNAKPFVVFVHGTTFCGDPIARGVKMENIGFQPYFAHGTLKRTNQGRKKLIPTLQQLNLVPRAKSDQTQGFGTRNSNSAISGKWSDIRPQIRPRGTCAAMGCIPRAKI